MNFHITNFELVVFHNGKNHTFKCVCGSEASQRELRIFCEDKKVSSKIIWSNDPHVAVGFAEEMVEEYLEPSLNAKK